MVLTKQQQSDIKNLVKEVVRECFSDEMFMAVFADKISTEVTKNLALEFEKIKKDVVLLKSHIAALQGENEMLKSKCEETTLKIEKLENQKEKSTTVDELKEVEILSKLTNLEQSNKLLQLRILGLPESKDENLKEAVTQLFSQSLGVEVHSLEYCRRVVTTNKNTVKSRPVTITFSNMVERNQVFYNKRKLKGHKIIIMEELIKPKYDLYKIAREKFGNDAWTKNGRIIVKVNEKKMIVESRQDIEINLKKKNEPEA